MTPATNVALVIAVKRLDAAKTRLSPTFTPPARAALVCAMLADTLTAAQAVPAVHNVTVVSPDPCVLSAAHTLGAHVMTDPTNTPHPDPLNEAVKSAEAVLRGEWRNIVVLQGDLPCLRSTELADALDAAAAHSRSFVGDRHGTGTTALFAFDALLNPEFGLDSAARHARSGAAELVGRWPGLRCDIDTPADIQVALRMHTGPATRSVLTEFDLRSIA